MEIHCFCVSTSCWGRNCYIFWPYCYNEYGFNVAQKVFMAVCNTFYNPTVLIVDNNIYLPMCFVFQNAIMGSDCKQTSSCNIELYMQRSSERFEWFHYLLLNQWSKKIMQCSLWSYRSVVEYCSGMKIKFATLVEQGIFYKFLYHFHEVQKSLTEHYDIRIVHFLL